MASNLLIPNIGSVRSTDAAAAAPSTEKANKAEFDKVLTQQVDGQSAEPASEQGLKNTGGIKFSNHAMERIRDRGIRMDATEASRLEKAMDTAAAKGSRETLVLTKDAAFIISVPNKTVITALDRAAANGNVFTNIDSTVVI